jgi:hypothetical protein
MKNKLLFLFFSIILATAPAKSQPKKLFAAQKAIVKNPFTLSMKDTLHKIVPTMQVYPMFYCNNLGFVCKQEIKFQKIIKLPFVFRLGSVQYVDYLEGKRGAVFSGQ